MTTKAEISAIINQIAEGWDGCMYDAPGETIDIGVTIRRAFAQLAPVSDAPECAALPNEAGWIAEHPKYGKWFMPRSAVVADWKQDQRDAYPGEVEREPDDGMVECWFCEQISWIEVRRDGRQLQRPDMGVFEAAWMRDMERDWDYTEGAIEVKDQ